jgi:hypothetical protein
MIVFLVSVWFFFNRFWIRVGFFRRWIFGFLQDTGPLTGFGIKDFGRCGLPLGNWTVGGFLSYWIPGFRISDGSWIACLPVGWDSQDLDSKTAFQDLEKNEVD